MRCRFPCAAGVGAFATDGVPVAVAIAIAIAELG